MIFHHFKIMLPQISRLANYWKEFLTKPLEMTYTVLKALSIIGCELFKSQESNFIYGK